MPPPLMRRPRSKQGLFAGSNVPEEINARTAMIRGVRAILSVVAGALRVIAPGFLLLVTTPLWASSALDIADAWAPATPPGARTAAVYLTVVNNGKEDVIVGASCDVSSTVELHTHAHVGGMMRMERLETVVVPAAAEVRFEPRGNHLMLIDLRSPLKPGDTIVVNMQFRDAGNMEFVAEVRDIRR